MDCEFTLQTGGTHWKDRYVVDFGLSGWETDAYTLTEGEANAITGYTALYHRIICYKVGGGTKRHGWLSATEVEIPDAGTPFTGTATAGSVGVTGNTGTLVVGWTGAGTAGSVAPAGNTGVLEVGWTGAATAGAVTLTGNQGVFATSFAGVASVGAVTITGTTAVLELGFADEATVGTLDLTGNTGVLQVGWTGTATVGAVTITGNQGILDTGAGASFQGVATAGAITVTGNTGLLEIGWTGTATAGAVTLTGTTGVLGAGWAGTATAGAVDLTGNTSTLEAGWAGAATAGAVDLTGNTGVIEAGWAGAATAGSVDLTGNQGLFQTSFEGVATVGAVDLTGNTGALEVGWTGTATVGAVDITGNTATLAVGAALQATAGAVDLTGNTGTLVIGIQLGATAGAVTITGNQGILDTGEVPGFEGVATAGAVGVSGNTPVLVYGINLTAIAGAVTLTGNTGELAIGWTGTATVGAVELTGNTGLFGGGWFGVATVGAVGLTGNAGEIELGFAGIATPGAVEPVSGDRLWFINWRWTEPYLSIGQPPRKPARMQNKPGTKVGLHTFLPLTDSSREYDISGRRRNVELNGPSWVNSIIGPALSFDEVDDHMIVSVGETFGNEFTVGIWFRVEDVVGSSYQYLISQGPFAPVIGENLHVYLSEGISPILRTAFQDIDDGPDTNALNVDATNLIDGRWHLYELRVTLSGTEVWVDGVLEASDATRGGDGYATLSSIYLGTRNDLEATRYFGGEIGAFWVYSIALPEADLMEQYVRPWEGTEEPLQAIHDVEVDQEASNILRSVGCCMQRTVWPVPFGASTTESDWKHISYTYRDFLSPPSATLFIPEELGLEALVELN
jgi:hypothetical protein